MVDELFLGKQIKIKDKIFEIIKLEPSPFILTNGEEQFNMTVKWVKDDLGEQLADLTRQI